MVSPTPLLKIGDTDHGNRVGGELWALRDVSFQVREGEILGIIGRNGAGKSTLLRILSRITAPTRGQVKIKGRGGSLLEVGTGCHPELTGHENINLNGAILGMKKAEIDRKLARIIDRTYVDWINRKARMTWHGDLRRRLAGVRKIGGALRRLKLDPPPTLEA